MLVGHPMTALERELKRLVLREELEKDQLKIVREAGLNSKDVRNIISVTMVTPHGNTSNTAGEGQVAPAVRVV